MDNDIKKLLIIIFIVLIPFLGFNFFTGLDKSIPNVNPDYYYEINNNVPIFEDIDSSKTFEIYSELDNLKRPQVAVANLSKETMPKEDRKSIDDVIPPGYYTYEFECVSGNYLYHRCHLIGFQLAGENDNNKNLITGTRDFNIEGMKPFEDYIAEYINETNNHVLYRVTPKYTGDNLIADGVQIEAKSVEDNGRDISFNVFVLNKVDCVEIDYATGKVKNMQDDNQDNNEDKDKENHLIRANSSSKVYHVYGQVYYENMKDSKNLIEFKTEEEAIEAGYRKAKK